LLMVGYVGGRRDWGSIKRAPERVLGCIWDREKP